MICGCRVSNTSQAIVNTDGGPTWAGAVQFFITDQVSAKFLLHAFRHMQLPHDYDYDADLRKTAARLDWLREQFMAAQYTHVLI